MSLQRGDDVECKTNRWPTEPLMNMKISRLGLRQRGFNIVEMLIVGFLVMVAVGLLLPMSHGSSRTTAARIKCVSNLKQIGLALRLWSNDHGEKFPMAVSTNRGGSLEFIGAGEVFRHFLAVSNELNSPKVLTCPTDKKREGTNTFRGLGARNLSYFVGLDADETQPQRILSGDRNLSTNRNARPGILTLDGKSAVHWTKEMHSQTANGGNLGLSDGSAMQASDETLNKQIGLSDRLPVRLEIP